MSTYQRFELRRLSDDLVYHFSRAARLDGTAGFRREDKDVWMLFNPTLGWVVLDEESQEITGKPWLALPHEQAEAYPPEGEWVSKKGNKSYVYRLRYVE